ncbi:MAG: hypothetical protein ACE5GE_05490 [Phycisphaerae bacterium]
MAAIGALVVQAALRGDITRHVREFQVVYCIALAGYAALMAIVWRQDAALRLGDWRRWLIVCAILRAGLAFTVPSDDVFRYVWEGRIQVAGFNPFAQAPDAEALTPLHDEEWARINHPGYKTIYPPLAQMVFAALAWVHPSVGFFKACFAGLDLLTVIVLGQWCRRLGRPPHQALIYGLCPLTLTTFGIDGHLDSLMLLLLALAGLALHGRRYYWAAGCLAGAIGAKVVAVVLLGWLAMRCWRAAVLCVLLVVGLYLPYASAGWGLVESLFRFAGGTAFFGLLHQPVAAWFGAGAAHTIGLGLLAAAVLASIRAGHSFERHGGIVLGTLMLVSPVAHYWYLTWVLLFVAVRPRWCWLILSGSMVFYFEAEQARLITKLWEMPAWSWYAVYGPFVTAWVIESWTARRTSRASA